MSLRPSRRVLAGVVVALLVATAWQLGERRGRERAELTDGARATRSDDAVDAPGGSRTGSANAALAALTGEREMLREMVRSLRAELERADRLSAAERAELELYRRIGAVGTATGLTIDTLERRRADLANGTPATLRLTLMQARGRERVTGRVEIVALGAEAADLPPESPGELRATLAAERRKRGATWTGSFDLRFFETLEIPLGDRFPEVVEIRVLPAAEAHGAFRSRHRREGIQIVD